MKRAKGESEIGKQHRRDATQAPRHARDGRAPAAAPNPRSRRRLASDYLLPHRKVLEPAVRSSGGGRRPDHRTRTSRPLLSTVPQRAFARSEMELEHTRVAAI